MGDNVRNRAVVALLNNETLWHMHKPIPESCKLELLHYYSPNPTAVNKTFWRSCSFILGAVVSQAFKENVHCSLHSFPSPNGKKLDSWQDCKFVAFTQMCYANIHPIHIKLLQLSLYVWIIWVKCIFSVLACISSIYINNVLQEIWRITVGTTILRRKQPLQKPGYLDIWKSQVSQW